MPPMENEGAASARWAGLFLVASGVLGLVNNHLPGSGYLNRGVLDAVAGLAVILGLIVPALPWDRWPPRASLALLPPSLAMVGAAETIGGLPPYSYAVCYVIIFVWIGLTQRPGTACRVAPFAILAYVAPGVLGREADTAAVSSVAVVIPVCLLVAEIIARVMRAATLRADLLRVLVMANGKLSALDSAEVVDAALAMTIELGLDGAYLAEIDEKSELFRVVAASGLDDFGPGSTFPLSTGVSSRVRDGGTVIVEDYAAAADRLPVFARAGMKVAIAAPVWIGDDLVGVFTALSRRRVRLGVQEVEAFSLLAGQTGRALELARRAEGEREEARRAQEASLTDDLTGVGNRRVANALVGSLRTGDALLVIDLDDFKQVNDTYGHVAGDQVLSELGAVLRDHLRDDDGVARYGGEEFVVVLRNAGTEAPWPSNVSSPRGGPPNP